MSGFVLTNDLEDSEGVADDAASAKFKTEYDLGGLAEW